MTEATDRLEMIRAFDISFIAKIYCVLRYYTLQTYMGINEQLRQWTYSYLTKSSPSNHILEVKVIFAQIRCYNINQSIN